MVSMQECPCARIVHQFFSFTFSIFNTDIYSLYLATTKSKFGFEMQILFWKILRNHLTQQRQWVILCSHKASFSPKPYFYPKGNKDTKTYFAYAKLCSEHVKCLNYRYETYQNFWFKYYLMNFIYELQYIYRSKSYVAYEVMIKISINSCRLTCSFTEWH